MNIDFIKWLVEKAEGFKLNSDQLIFPEGGIETFEDHLFTLKVWKLVWYPLLLHGAFEGVNKNTWAQGNDKRISISIIPTKVSVHEIGKGENNGITLFWYNVPYQGMRTLDQAIEAALMYISEQ